MKTAGIIIAHPDDSGKLKALKAFMKALHIKFEVHTNDRSPYNSDFVDMVLQGDKDLKEGKGEKISLEDLDKLWK